MSSHIVWLPGITLLFCLSPSPSVPLFLYLSVKQPYYSYLVLELITGAIIIIIINAVGIPSTFPDILPPARQNSSDQLYAQICCVSWPMQQPFYYI